MMTVNKGNDCIHIKLTFGAYIVCLLL